MSQILTYEIRPATLRDARAVAEVHAKSSLAIYKQWLSLEKSSHAAVDTRVSYWREAIEYAEPQVHVAVREGKVIGMVGFDRSRDPKTRPTTGEIWAIHVLPEFVGTGVGLALWDTARDGLSEEGCTEVTAWVPLCNERALRFHELAGFKRELNTARTTPLGSIKIEEIRLKRRLI